MAKNRKTKKDNKLIQLMDQHTIITSLILGALFFIFLLSTCLVITDSKFNPEDDNCDEWKVCHLHKGMII